MDIQEALNELKRQVKCWQEGKDFQYEIEPLEVAIAAMEQQMSKTPVECKNEANGTYCICPICGKVNSGGEKTDVIEFFEKTKAICEEYSDEECTCCPLDEFCSDGVFAMNREKAERLVEMVNNLNQDLTEE